MTEEGYRTEKKYLISTETAILLRDRFAPFMQPDPHAPAGEYRIRSLYFDTPDAEAFWEKTAGVDDRRKYRLRFYNGDASFIRLELKQKQGDLGRKTSARVDEETARALQAGEYAPLLESGDPFLRAFYAEARATGLKPAVTVDYRRVPFLYRIDNVRITVDSDVRAGSPLGFFSSAPPPFGVLDPCTALLEVKTDDRLPVFLGRLLESVPRQPQSFSKYALCFARLHGIE